MNVPPYWMLRQYWPVYSWMIERLIQLEQFHPDAQLTSWYRGERHNADVGGNPFSQHLLGFAFDLTAKNPPGLAATAQGLGFVAVQEPSHVHLQSFPAGTIPHSVFSGQRRT